MSTTTVWKGLVTVALLALMIWLYNLDTSAWQLISLFLVSVGFGSFVVQTIYSIQDDAFNRRVENWD